MYFIKADPLFNLEMKLTVGSGLSIVSPCGCNTGFLTLSLLKETIQTWRPTSTQKGKSIHLTNSDSVLLVVIIKTHTFIILKLEE